MSSALPWFTESSANRLSDVRDTSLSKLVRDDMLALILKGVLTPGQRISEPEVASRLQVSRVPVREALRELESSGLVVSRKHSGVFVRQLVAAEIHDLYQMRGLLDGFAGRCAAQLPQTQREALLALLDASIEAMRAAASERWLTASASRAADGTSTQRSRTASGAPLVAKVRLPLASRICTRPRPASISPTCKRSPSPRRSPRL